MSKNGIRIRMSMIATTMRSSQQAAKSIELTVTEGDWLSLSEIGLRRDPMAKRIDLSYVSEWDQPVAHIVYDANNREQPFAGPKMEDRQWLWETTILPWQQATEAGTRCDGWRIRLPSQDTP